MKIKVCGMVSPGNLEQVCSLEPDFVGFIFYAASKRFVGESPDPALFRIPAAGIRKVGVFVNESLEKVRAAFESGQLHMLQLHGDESPEYCRILSSEGFPLVKALSVLTDPGLLEEYREHVEFFLFDTPDPGYGGSGRKFDWNHLQFIPSSIPFLLSGGIGAGDAGAVGKVKHDGLLGVDLNSAFELSPGIKDVKLLKEFMQNISKK
jgi:phosphoribosylanthranilate isomerase